MVLGLIGGDIRQARPLVELYRRAGLSAGHPARVLRLGLTSHFFVADTSQAARDTFYPYYREYLRPKTPGGRGWLVSTDHFAATAGPTGALMTGSPQEIIDKILTERDILGIDRFIGQIDLGGLPPHLVNRSIELLATQVAPAIRQETTPSPGGPCNS